MFQVKGKVSIRFYVTHQLLCVVHPLRQQDSHSIGVQQFDAATFAGIV